jgi:hypothetical protein
VATVTPGSQWPSGCPLSGRGDYRRVFVQAEVDSIEGTSIYLTREAVLGVMGAQTEARVLPANLGCSSSGSTVWIAFDVPEVQVASMVATPSSSAPITTYSSQYAFLFDGSTTFSPCPIADYYFGDVILY